MSEDMTSRGGSRGVATVLIFASPGFRRTHARTHALRVPLKRSRIKKKTYKRQREVEFIF